MGDIEELPAGRGCIIGADEGGEHVSWTDDGLSNLRGAGHHAPKAGHLDGYESTQSWKSIRPNPRRACSKNRFELIVWIIGWGEKGHSQKSTGERLNAVRDVGRFG